MNRVELADGLPRGAASHAGMGDGRSPRKRLRILWGNVAALAVTCAITAGLGIWAFEVGTSEPPACVNTDAHDCGGAGQSIIDRDGAITYDEVGE